MKQIITSILDNDLYKFSMMYAVIRQFPYTRVRYKLILRSDITFTQEMVDEIKIQIKLMENLYLTDEEYRYVSTKLSAWIDPTFFIFLRGYRFHSKQITISFENGKLSLDVEGPWYSAILWEVPVMAIISEVYFYYNEKGDVDHSEFMKRCDAKIKLIKDSGIIVSDFGTRRRRYKISQDYILQKFAEANLSNFVGSSNVYFCMKYGWIPKGTQAHEWYLVMAALYGYVHANEMGMKKWVEVYQGKLGTVLPDTFTTDVFLRSFDGYYARLFDDGRQDSGQPFAFTDKWAGHYDNLNINPMSKDIIYSDNLFVEKAVDIRDKTEKIIPARFGIGTNFTNDYPGLKPVNMVIKLCAVFIDGIGWVNVLKLSDDVGKHTGTKEEADHVKRILNI